MSSSSSASTGIPPFIPPYDVTMDDIFSGLEVDDEVETMNLHPSPQDDPFSSLYDDNPPIVYHVPRHCKRPVKSMTKEERSKRRKIMKGTGKKRGPYKKRHLYHERMKPEHINYDNTFWNHSKLSLFVGLTNNYLSLYKQAQDTINKQTKYKQ